MIPAVVSDPASGQPVVVASLERQRVAVEKDIQEACSEFLNEPDWNKNMGIVDALNRSPYLCPFATKEIRKQLKTKNPEIEILALQLTETIIKNCPSSHAAVAQEDFMRYLVKVGTNQREGGKWTQFKSKMAKKKTSINAKHVRAQCIEKALLILKMLAIAYSESHLYPVFKATYKQLEAQNVRFPETNKDESLNIFSPMHSSGAPDEFGGPTALGSVQNPNLPMIRPVIILEGVTDEKLVQAQESAQLLFQMINAPVLSYDLIPDLTAMLNQSQQMIVIMISEGNAPENVLMQALQVNDIVNQVLEDAQAILNGTKRRYQEEVNVANLMAENSNKDDKKDANDDEPELEHSISIEADDKDAALFALSAPDKDKVHKRRPSKKSSRQSIDLLGMTDDKNGNDLMAAINGDNDNKQPQKKQESEEDLMGFLGINPQQNNPPKPSPPKPTVFDPLEDEPPAAYTQYNKPPPNNNNNYNNNNGNVFRNNNNYNNNNGNMMNGSHNNNIPKVNAIQRGNDSVLNVLTGGEQSHTLPNSSNNSSISPSPQKPQPQQPQKPMSAAMPNNGNSKGDPFADIDDPFADMTAPSYEDALSKPKTKPQSQPKPQPQPKANANDPFADMAGSAFDDPALNMLADEPQPKQQENKPPPNKNIIKPARAPPKKQDSNAIILDMFATGADPDPNSPQQKKQAPPKQPDDSNPFNALANPFGSEDNVAKPVQKKKDDNPFDTLDNPFASDGDMMAGGDSQGDIDADNPFAMFTPMGNTNNNGNTKKKEDFMPDRDPFADM